MREWKEKQETKNLHRNCRKEKKLQGKSRNKNRNSRKEWTWNKFQKDKRKSKGEKKAKSFKTKKIRPFDIPYSVVRCILIQLLERNDTTWHCAGFWSWHMACVVKAKICFFCCHLIIDPWSSIMEPPWVKLHEIQGDVAPAIWPKLDENRHGEHWVRNRSAESKLFPSFARGVGGER